LGKYSEIYEIQKLDLDCGYLTRAIKKILLLKIIDWTLGMS